MKKIILGVLLTAAFGANATVHTVYSCGSQYTIVAGKDFIENNGEHRNIIGVVEGGETVAGSSEVINAHDGMRLDHYSFGFDGSILDNEGLNNVNKADKRQFIFLTQIKRNAKAVEINYRLLENTNDEIYSCVEVKGK